MLKEKFFTLLNKINKFSSRGKQTSLFLDKCNRSINFVFNRVNKVQYWIILGVLFLPLQFVKGTNVILENPIDADTFQELVEAILKVVVTIGTPIAILAIIYSGFLFVKARGKPEDLVTARTALMWTIIGVAVLLGAQLLAIVISGTITNLGSGV